MADNGCNSNGFIVTIMDMAWRKYLENRLPKLFLTLRTHARAGTHAQAPLRMVLN